MEKIKQLQQIIDQSKRIVFFGGAGVSTESGIADFRSADGLYHQKYKYNPETILSHTFFVKKTAEFFELVESLEKRLNYAKENTSLPKNPDYKKINDFVMSVNERIVKDNVF